MGLGVVGGVKGVNEMDDGVVACWRTAVTVDGLKVLVGEEE